MDPLTPRQERVLNTILRFLDAEDRPPTTRELASKLGCHVKTVYQYILALERKGYIERRKGHLRVSPEVRQQHHGIPIVGRVAAGVPIMALANREGVLSLQGLFGTQFSATEPKILLPESEPRLKQCRLTVVSRFPHTLYVLTRH